MASTTENLIPESEGEQTRAVVSVPERTGIEISDAASKVVTALREGYRSVEMRGHNINEAETRMLLIGPVLEALGFPPSHRRPEDGNRGNRPDEICYDREVVPEVGPAALILEAKALGRDFDVSEQQGRRASSPDRQIQRYLRQHVASGPSTLGILTDGVRWRFYERSGADVVFRTEYDFTSVARQFWRSLSSFSESKIAQFDAFVEIATRCYLKPEPSDLIGVADPVIQLLDAVSANASPRSILQLLVSDEEIETRRDIDDQVALSSIQEDMFETDWAEHEYLVGPDTSPTGQLSLSDQLTVGVLRFRYLETGLGRGDTAMSARIFARASGSGMAVLLVYSVAPDGSVEARLAACADGRVNMTAVFDPELPLPSSRIAIGEVIELLRRGLPLTADDVLGPLEVMPLRQQFYREVSRWTWELQRNQGLAYRHAVLKHLIRVIFSWILKEEGIIPPELFEYAYVANHLDNSDDYHSEVLKFLFHERLNVLEDVRTAHDISGLNEMLDRAPFLNGSLFAKDVGEPDLDLPVGLYWNVDDDEPGLFTIFNRYHWTTDEHRPGESEQTLDPELLSNLFEQLITPTEEGNEPPPRQPRGTYYTPADVADEMVKDALTAAVEVRLPSLLTSEQLMNLFGNADEPVPTVDATDKANLADRIKTLRIFDPAVGSGEFLFSCLIAIKTALTKLNGSDPRLTREIVRDQLAGQDINALATQITRLRLFVAIVSAEKGNRSREPLPNLEARVVCADSLETVADPNWRPDRASNLGDVDPGFAVALTELAANRRRWFDAHSEEAKSELREADDALREELNSYLVTNGNGTVISREFKGFVEFPLLGTGLECATTDARLLFYEPNWQGFDIVIGNPPYERLSQSVGAERKASLIEDKRYKTTNVNDLYSLFCEIGLALAKPSGGIVTMIVPLSIAFGQRQIKVRRLFEERSGMIDLRHYDNRPDTTFNASPTVRSPSNSQRTTIFTARIDDASVMEMRTTGLQRWASEDRKLCLSHRGAVELSHRNSHADVRISGQWPRIPSRAVAKMIQAKLRQNRCIGDFVSEQGDELSLPRTAGYFLNCIPSGLIEQRRERVFRMENAKALKLAMAATNGHVGYAWWRIFSDTFDVNVHEITSMPIPDTWLDEPEPAIRLADELIAAIPQCRVEMRRVGQSWENVNFHLRPDLIEELDRLHIEALGLDVEPLLSQLKIMRSSSSWDFSGTV